MINRAIINSISSGICIVDERFSVKEWNTAMVSLTGITRSEILDSPLSLFFPRFSDESITLRLNMLIAGGAPMVFSPLLNRDLFLKAGMKEQDLYLEVTVTSITMEGETFLLFTVRDVTELNLQILQYRKMRDKAVEEVEMRSQVESELRKANERLEELASTDPLTGLFNRRQAIKSIKIELNRALRHKCCFSIIIADIDFFKTFNDTHGHDCGDSVLVQLAGFLKNNIRTIDTISRWGGEEFLVLLPETCRMEAREAAEKLRKQISDRKFIYKNEELSIFMTFGISSYRDLDSIDSIIKRADEALYQGKEQGRNCVIIS